MTDMLETIIPKSDQTNADDFIGGPRTIKITNVTIAMGEQPVSIHYEGDNGKPYKPGKSMRRLLVRCWGADANLYAGRSLTLYRDEKVTFGGQQVGGIRISYMSDIEGPITMALTASKAVKKQYVVQPLPGITITDMQADIETAPTIEGLEFKFKAAYKAFPNAETRAQLTAAKDKRKAELLKATPVAETPPDVPEFPNQINY